MSVPKTKKIPETNHSLNLEKIQKWLIKIGEPEEDHHLVLDKCINDPEAMEYFLKHANNEFEG